MEIVMADDHVIRVNGKEEQEPDLLEKSIIEALKDDPVNTVKLLVRICENGMMGQAHKWERYSRKYRRGLRYVTQEGAKNPLYSTNYIYNVVESVKANLTSNLPALTMQPVEDGDDVTSDIFTKLLRVELKKANLKSTTERVVQHGALTGAGWYKLWFNPDAFFGKGGLALEALAQEDVLVMPTMLDYRHGDVFIHRLRDRTEQQIKAQYGIKKLIGVPDRSLLPEDRNVADLDKRIANIRTFSVYECWVLDYETGDWYICTIAGSTVLRKPEKSPYKHGRAPFVPWYDNFDVRADHAYALGAGEVEEIEPLQDLADALDMRIYKNVKQITGRQRVLNPASGINREDIDDSPNRVYLCTGRPADAILWDNPPSLDQSVYVYREKIEERIQVVSGIMDVTQGKKPSGIQAARAVSALQAAAAKRLEKKTELLVDAIQDVGSMAAQIILDTDLYSEERIVRMAGKMYKIIGEYPEELQGESEDELQQAQLDEMRGVWKQQNGIDLVLSDVNYNYDIIASTDSALPEDKADRVQVAADLFRLGAIDRQALLDALDYPDRTEILKRLQPPQSQPVTGQTPPEALPENQQGMAQAQATSSAIDMQAQLAQQLKTAYGAMAPMPEIPVR